LTNTDGLILCEKFLISSEMIFAQKSHQTSSRTVLSDDVTVRFAFVDIEALDDVGMIEHFEDFNFILQELHG
jgi:hypothetical protein